MINKTCYKCKIEKEASLFYKRHNQCKECFKKYYKEYCEKNKEKIAEHHKKYHLKNRENILKQQKEYRENNKEKVKNSGDKWKKENKGHIAKFAKDYSKRPESVFKNKCRRRTRTLRECGKIKEKPCEVCGEIKIEVHHNNYKDPYDVRWLCRKHHKELHLKIKRELQ